MTARRFVPAIIGLSLIVLVPITIAAQGRGNPNPLRTINKTIYTPKTEFFGAPRSERAKLFLSKILRH